ncbi:MAG: HEAT repeat domain-containing protein [Planctomycetota bacterium]
MSNANRCIRTLLVLLLGIAVSAGEAGADKIIPKTDAEIVNEAHIIVDATVTEIILPPAEAIEKKMCYSIAVLKVNEVLKDTNGQAGKDGTIRFVYLSHGRSSLSWGPDSYAVGERGIFALSPVIGGWLQGYGIAVAEGPADVKWRNPYRLHYNQQIQAPAFRKLAAVSASPEKALRDSDPTLAAGAIYLAARKQREKPSQELVNAILAGMKSGSEELVKEASRAAGFLKLKEAVSIGIASLKAGGRLTEPARALAGIGEPAVAPLAEIARTDKSAQVRARAVEVLAEMLTLVARRQAERRPYHAAVQELLVERLADPAEPVVKAAADGLGQLDLDAKLLTKVLQAFNTTPSDQVAHRLGHCLYFRLHPLGFERVWQQLGDDDPTVAARSARVVGGSTTEAVAKLDVQPLRRYLKKHPPSETEDASHALAKLRRDPGTLPCFVKLYESTGSPWAIDTIGHIGGGAAVEYLAPLVRSDHPHVAALATFALSRTREPDLAGKAMAAAAAHKDPQVRKAAARAILIYAGQAQAFLEGMLKNEQDQWARKVIEQSLSALKDRQETGGVYTLYNNYEKYVLDNALGHWRKQRK